MAHEIEVEVFEDIDTKKLSEKPTRFDSDSGQHQRNPVYPSPSDLLFIEGGFE